MACSQGQHVFPGALSESSSGAFLCRSGAPWLALNAIKENVGASECRIAHRAIGLPKAPGPEPAARIIPQDNSGAAVAMAEDIFRVSVSTRTSEQRCLHGL